MNNKGFSLVELLAIITIIGVIMGIAIVSHQKQVTKTRNEGYKTLLTTVRTAAQNRYMAEGMPQGCKKYDVVIDLYGSGYMDKPADPASSATNCNGNVYIKNDSSGDTMENYYIKVDLDCSVYDPSDCKDSGGADCSSISFSDCS